MRKEYENPAVYVLRFDLSDHVTADPAITMSDIVEEAGPWQE